VLHERPALPQPIFAHPLNGVALGVMGELVRDHRVPFLGAERDEERQTEHHSKATTIGEGGRVQFVRQEDGIDLGRLGGLRQLL